MESPMNTTNLILVAILCFLIGYAATDGFEPAPTALENHEALMKKIGLRP